MAKALSGNRIEIQINGAAVGLAQNVRASDDYGHEPASGIGDIHVQEYVPSMAVHELTVESMVLAGQALPMGAKNGGDALKGMVFDVAIISKDGGGVLRKYTGCSFVSGSIDVRKHAIVATDARIKALDAG